MYALNRVFSIIAATAIVNLFTALHGNKTMHTPFMMAAIYYFQF